MWILKKINNNCALARDDSGQDLVVFGRGIAYRRPPYELKDLSQVERTFYGVGGASVAALKDIPEDVLLLAADIIDFASDKLDVDFNPNAPVTLADHINFAIERVKSGVVIETPLAFDVMRLYPREVKIARRAITLIKSRLKLELPEAEVTNIALHLIDGEAEQSNMDATVRATRVIDDVTRIVARHLGKIDTASFTYARFAMHVRFLVDRIQSGEESDSGMGAMLPVMRREYPDAFKCVADILAYFVTEQGWKCDESETLYLLMHVQRLATSLEGPEAN
mgnify:CR=1 FL=1